MASMQLGTGYDDPYRPITKDAARALGQNGIGFPSAIVLIALDFVYEAGDEPNQQRWSVYDETISRYLAEGIEVVIKAMWMPPRASGGKSAYRRNELGLWQNDPSWLKDGGWHLAAQCIDATGKPCAACKARPERVEMANNPPMPSAGWLEMAGHDLATRYGTMVDKYIFGNEPDETLFSPWIRLANLGKITRAKAFAWYEIMRASLQAGVLSVQPDAKFAGPEAAYFGGFQQALQNQEASNGIAYHFTTHHMYAPAGTFPQGSYDRMENEFRATWEQFILSRGIFREGWITEIDDQGTGRMPEFIRECQKRYPWITRVYPYSMEPSYFENWPLTPGATPKLTKLGREMADLNRELANEREPLDITAELSQMRAAIDAIARKAGTE